MKPKPDDRSDNVQKIQRNIQNTIQNLEEAEEYLVEHADEISGTELKDIIQKNQNRRESIAGFRREVKDEAHDH